MKYVHAYSNGKSTWYAVDLEKNWHWVVSEEDGKFLEAPKLHKLLPSRLDPHAASVGIVAAQRFREAWRQFFQTMPEEMRPADNAPICPCGCGKPMVVEYRYPDPKVCKVRACRKNARRKADDALPKLDFEAAPASAVAEIRPPGNLVIDWPWFKLSYTHTHRDVWLVHLVLNGTLESHPTLAHGLLDHLLEQAKRIAGHAYVNDQESYVGALWKISQHVAFMDSRLDPNLLEKKINQHSEGTIKATAIARVSAASRLMPLTPETEAEFRDILLGVPAKPKKEVVKRATSSEVAKEAAKVEMFVLQTLKEGQKIRMNIKLAWRDDKHGHTPRTNESIDKAIDRLVKRGDIVKTGSGPDGYYALAPKNSVNSTLVVKLAKNGTPAARIERIKKEGAGASKTDKSQSLTNRVLRALNTSNYELRDLCELLGIPEGKFSTLRSTINILIQQGVVTKHGPLAGGVFEYGIVQS